MGDDSRRWLRHFFYFLLATALVQLSQTALAVFLWRRTGSAVLLVFGLDASVGAFRELILARRIQREGIPDSDSPKDGVLFAGVGIGYLVVGGVAALVGVTDLWQGRRPEPTLLGVALAAVSMLVIPVIGSYLKALAMELGSPALKTAAIFTFGNSYLSMVLLISLLVNAGMERWWSDALGALVMVPFIVQKGIQILLERRGPEFAED